MTVHPVWIARDRELAEIVDRILETVAADDSYLLTTPTGVAQSLTQPRASQSEP